MSIELSGTLEYLGSQGAVDSVDLDPYWPKWDSPWWHLTVLYEMGEVRKAPQSIIDKFLEKLDSHYIKIFPLVESEIPEGVDPYRHIFCHCSLATMYKVLSAYGVDVDGRLPWMREWILNHQLPDGGLNCDEAAYTKSKKSSMLSTMPALEAILDHTNREFTDQELDFLDGGAKYLIEHQLCRRKSNGEIINQEWLKLCFPRFYDYDILRGLSFLCRWSSLRQVNLPKEVLNLAEELLERFSEGAVVERQVFVGEGSMVLNEGDWAWESGSLSAFPLLTAVSEVGSRSPCLNTQIEEIAKLKKC